MTQVVLFLFHFLKLFSSTSRVWQSLWNTTHSRCTFPPLSHLSLRKVCRVQKPFWTLSLPLILPSLVPPLSLSLQWPKCNLLCLHLSEHMSCQPRTRSWLHLVSADSSPLCLWLFGSQSALAKHATETCKEPLPRLATAQLATSTQRELKPTFCPGGKQRERLTLPNPSSYNAHTCTSCIEKMNASSNRFLCGPGLWLMNS